MNKEAHRATLINDSTWPSLFTRAGLTISLIIGGLIWLLVAAVVVTPRVLDLDVFYARDELAIWPWADEFAAAIRHGDLAGTLTTSDYPGIPMFWVQTAFLGFKYAFPSFFPDTMRPFESISQDRSIELLAERRLAAGLFISLQIIAAVWLVRRLFGWTAALLAAVFLGLDPFSLTEARVLRLEMISALFVCLNVLTFLVYLRERGRRWLLLSGVMAGLGVSSKTSAGLIVPYIWFLLLFDFLFEISLLVLSRRWVDKFKRLMRDGLIWAAGAIGAFWLIWPAMWIKPVEALHYIFVTGFGQAANRSVWGDKVFFWGKIVDGGDPGPFFYPVVFAFRTTPLTWIGIISALVFAVYYLRQQSQSKIENTQRALRRKSKIENSVTAILLLLVYIVLIMIELSFVISKVDRFLLIIFPIVNILSALGLALLLEGWSRSAARRLSPLARTGLIAGGVILLLVLQLAITIPVHPYYFTYWNPLVGGGRAAMAAVPMGAGEGIDLAMTYLNDQPNAAETSVVCGASEPWCENIFQGTTLRSASYDSGEWATADYTSLYISQLQRQTYPPEIVDFFMARTPKYTVDLQGATYVWVYDVPPIEHFAGPWNNLAGLGQLLGYNLSPSLAGGSGGQPGDPIAATVWWTNLGAGVDNLVLRWVDETGYEWGRAPVVPQPPYDSLPADKRAIVVGTAALTIAPGTPPGTYFLRLGVVEPGPERLLGEFKIPDEGSRLTIRPGRTFDDLAAFTIPYEAKQRLAPEIRLLGYAPPEQVLTADVPTWLTLFWQATSQPADYLVLLRLLDANGQEVTSWMGRPAHNSYPTSSWQPGEIVKDVWALQVEPDVPVGPYALDISLFKAAAGPQKAPLDPAFTIHNLEVWPQPIRYDASDMQVKLGVNFGDRLTLLGYDLYFDTNGARQGSLSPVFYWQSQADMQAAFDILLTLRSADAAQVIQTWRLPLGSDQPKTLWKANEVASTIYRLDDLTVGQGRYHLDIALHDRRDDQPILVKPANGPDTTFTRIEDIQDKIVVRLVN